MSAAGQPPKDLALSNLVVTGKSIHGDLIANHIHANNITLQAQHIEFTPSDFFVLHRNGCVKQTTVITVSFSGIITGNVGAGVLPIGFINSKYAPVNNIIIPVACSPPNGVIVAQLNTSGEVETCVTGAPFPNASYEISFTATYLRVL